MGTARDGARSSVHLDLVRWHTPPPRSLPSDSNQCCLSHDVAENCNWQYGSGHSHYPFYFALIHLAFPAGERETTMRWPSSQRWSSASRRCAIRKTPPNPARLHQRAYSAASTAGGKISPTSPSIRKETSELSSCSVAPRLMMAYGTPRRAARSGISAAG